MSEEWYDIIQIKIQIQNFIMHVPECLSVPPIPNQK